MKPFLAVSIALVPILITGGALRYISRASQRYTLAEQNVIEQLQRYTKDRERYEYLMHVKGELENFLAALNPDISQLANAITLIDGVTRGLKQHESEVIAGILRRGSDRNRARYIIKLIDAVEPPRPGRDERGSPDPDPNPYPPPPPSARPSAIERAPRTKGPAPRTQER
jgi:hypothetical protein